jgi:hypothetical protein
MDTALFRERDHMESRSLGLGFQRTYAAKHQEQNAGGSQE